MAKHCIQYLIIKMGNESCSFPRIISKDFQLPDLKNRSTYGQHNGLPDETIVKAIFNQSYNANRRSMVAKKIEDNSENLFEDEKFKLDSKENSRLSVLFDFQRMKTRIYSTKGDVELTSFIQLNIEFCYLTCVFYFLCRKEIRENLMKQIIETQETNKFGAYSLTLFSNGEKHSVIIDDKMPTNADSFLYLRIVKGIQLWPLILEKAWCKQIGSYDKAKGLSPEDAFEQITGIPAYSHKFRADNRSLIKSMLATADSEKYWVTLVARNGLQDLKNRQVFYLESVNNDDSYTIISPFSSFRFENYQQKKRGEVIVKEQDIFTHFQYVVIGFYKAGYTNTSLNVQSRSREELLFSLNVKGKEDIIIRFNQLYEGYLEEEERLNYQYSPILIELYQVNENAGVKGEYTLVYDCQGCNRSLSGARSAHCAKNILESLEGKYIIRMEVEWQHEQLLHKGNLAVYSSKDNVILTQLKNNGQMFTEVYKQFFDRRIPKEDISVLNEHNLQIRKYDKLNTTLLCFKNLINSIQTFEIDFKNSKNIMIRGGIVNNQKTTITIEGQQSVIIELLPRSIREGLVLQAFDLTKVEKRQ